MRFGNEQKGGTALWLLLAVVIVYAGYFYYTHPRPCIAPITYKIGTLDPRFGVSKEDFIKDIGTASVIWDKGEGKTLFEYSPTGVLTINLVYDTRQATTQKENVLTQDINTNTLVADSVKQQFSALQMQYNNSVSSYNDTLATYKNAQQKYESDVAYWNANGGAPRAQYDQLQEQRLELLRQGGVLEQERQGVNSLADQINSLIDKYNLVVAHINQNVNAINTDGLAGTQFEEGEYVSDISGEHINIYQFDSQIFFIRVLAHELGHALSLDHNDNPDSIMNPINSSQNLKLTKEDLASLKAECNSFGL